MSDDQIRKRVWDSYIPEPFLSKVAQQRESPLITKNSALLVIDLYNLVFEGGNRSLQEEGLFDHFPATCGEKAYQAIVPTNQLISLFRDRALPIFFPQRILKRPKKMGTQHCVPEKRLTRRTIKFFLKLIYTKVNHEYNLHLT